MAYAIAVAVNGVLLFGANVRPGRDAVPFLTSGTDQVLGLINLCLLAGLGANMLNLTLDRPGIRAVGDLATSAAGLAAVIRLLRVFPFAFPSSGFDWALLARILLGVGIAGLSTCVLAAILSVCRHSGDHSRG